MTCLRSTIGMVQSTKLSKDHKIGNKELYLHSIYSRENDAVYFPIEVVQKNVKRET